ncbi:ATP-dependent DNA helicase RecQ-like [Mya arenaria]|uniref:ATP-dependent DNA helicase RecQ-like n=1 Tax=Mya arenaria TaxID=6604 RepID=UPI0022E586D5|nr:ATP-dependent DNA helicase RecQ-like [Mya arenaria]
MDASDEKNICDFFNIDSLFQNQKFAIKNILDKKDVLISTKTSSGKSLCYQALPVLTRSSVLVFSPLISIMEDQVSFLNRLGLNSTSKGNDTKDNDRVKKGDFDVMFTSPETVLENEMWRDVLMCSQFRQRLCAIVVDEAHIVFQWDEGTKNSDPFRKWFCKTGEVRSLCPGLPFLILTGTARKRTKQALPEKEQDRLLRKYCVWIFR